MMIFKKLSWVKLSYIIVTLVFTFSAGLCQAEDKNTYINQTIGFKITKPEAWHYATVAQNLENLKKIEFGNPEFQTALQNYASSPLVILTKFSEPFDDLNPSLKVGLKPYGALSRTAPVDIINILLPQFKKIFSDLTLTQVPVDYNLAGIKSAYARFNYTLTTADGNQFPTTSELWIVPYGDYFFLIGAGTRQDELTGTRTEIHDILKTIIIEQ